MISTKQAQTTSITSPYLAASLLLYLTFNLSIVHHSFAEPLSKEQAEEDASVKPDPAVIAALQADQKLLYVKGMVCGMCVQGISKLLGGVEGVKKVDINLEGGSVLVTVSPTQQPSDQALSKAVARAGYEVQSIHAAPTQAQGSIPKK